MKLKYFIYLFLLHSFDYSIVKAEIKKDTNNTNNDTKSRIIINGKTSHCDLNFGYYFYCNEEERRVELERQRLKEQEQEAQKEEPEGKARELKSKERNHQAELEAIQQELQRLQVKAVIEPTESNIRDYLYYQKAVLDRSSRFADAFRRVVWADNNLDYTRKRPVNTIVKHKWVDERKKEIEKTLKSLSKRYGLFFVYRSDCHYCHQYAPILNRFSLLYDINIVAISLDGNVLNGWEARTIGYDANRKTVNSSIQKEILNSITKKFGFEITQTPATILYDNQVRVEAMVKTKKKDQGRNNIKKQSTASNEETIIVGYGVLSISDLEERIYNLTSVDIGEGF